MSAINDLIDYLSVLASQHPDAPVSFQLSNGTEFELETKFSPYEFDGVIVVPIRSDEDEEPA